MDDLISRQAAIDALAKAARDKFNLSDEFNHYLAGLMDGEKAVRDLPSAQPEWSNHTVACLLAELFGDTCACNYNGIDEWLPGKCELLDSCPNPSGVECWEQFLKHRAERREE